MPYLVCRGVGLIGNMKHQSKNVYDTFCLCLRGSRLSKTRVFAMVNYCNMVGATDDNKHQLYQKLWALIFFCQ